jgi:hypothetical protein
MNLKIATGAIALFTFSGPAGLATAQDITSTTHRKTRALSGCLAKSADAVEYQLTTKAGGTWEIKSDSVKLGPHVGHSVMVTGVVPDATLHGLKDDTKSEAREHGINKSSTEHGHMTVTNLKMVSTSCDR